MTRRDRALPLEFSLLRSEFNDFLFATIGEEENHASLTVLSALSRQGIDPWDEAARLGRLPKKIATQELVAMIDALPGDADSALLAARLVDLLPRRPARKPRAMAGVYDRHPRIFQIVTVLICVGLVAVSFLLVAGRS